MDWLCPSITVTDGRTLQPKIGSHDWWELRSVIKNERVERERVERENELSLTETVELRDKELIDQTFLGKQQRGWQMNLIQTVQNYLEESSKYVMIGCNSGCGKSSTLVSLAMFLLLKDKNRKVILSAPRLLHCEYLLLEFFKLQKAANKQLCNIENDKAF